MLDPPPAHEHAQQAQAGTDLPALAAGLAEVRGVDPHPAVSARLEAHPLEQLPGRRLPGAQRLCLAAQGAKPICQFVAHAFERTEVEQSAGGGRPAGPPRARLGNPALTAAPSCASSLAI